MTIRTAIRAACGALIAASIPLCTLALPGQTLAQFKTWAAGNSALHGLTQKVGDMSGTPYFTATFKAGASAGVFNSSLDDHKVVNESVAVSGVPDNYDILKHLDLATAMLQAVYGANGSADFSAAKKVGQWTLKDETSPTALYRGKLYGYEAAHAFVKIIPLADVDNEAKTLASCVTNECGD